MSSKYFCCCLLDLSSTSLTPLFYFYFLIEKKAPGRLRKRSWKIKQHIYLTTPGFGFVKNAFDDSATVALRRMFDAAGDKAARVIRRRDAAKTQSWNGLNGRLAMVFGCLDFETDKKTMENFVKGIFDNDDALSVVAKLSASDVSCNKLFGSCLWQQFLTKQWKGSSPVFRQETRELLQWHRSLNSTTRQLSQYRPSSENILKKLTKTPYRVREMILDDLLKYDPPGYVHRALFLLKEKIEAKSLSLS